MKKILLNILIFALILSIGVGWHLATAGFHLRKIWFDMPQNPQWEVTLSSEQKEQILPLFDQEFTYLGKGRQSYVFQSKDGEYVIKLFRYHLVRPRFGIHLMQFCKKWDDYRKYRLKGKRVQFENWMTSYKIAYDRLQKESGILYVHLTKTHDLQKKLHIKDKLGRSYSIDLDTAGFLVQKKVAIFSETIQELVRKKDIDGLKKILPVYLQTIAQRDMKGVQNKDHCWLKNYGNIGLDQIYEIDAGRYSNHPPSSNPSDLILYMLRYGGHLREYLQENIPEIIPFFDQEITSIAKKSFL